MNEKIDELVCCAYHRRLTEPEYIRLAVWRATSARHEAYYRDLLRLLTTVASTARRQVCQPPPVEALLARSRQHPESGS